MPRSSKRSRVARGAARRARRPRPAPAVRPGHVSDNFAVARLFDLMGDVLEIKGENPFRIRAYRRAATNLRTLTEDVATLAREERLDEVPGIGSDLAGKIVEYLDTGRIKDLEDARRGVPRGVVELMNVPGIGPTTAKVLYEKRGVTSLDRLEKLARAGALRGTRGIGAKTEQNILKGLAIVRAGQERMPLAEALRLGEELVEQLRRVPGVRRAELAGSLRRRKDTIGDIDVLVATSRPEAVMRTFVALPQAREVLEQGATKAAIRHREGIQVDLRVVEPDCFGAALAYFTGSKQHNIRLRERALKKGLTISEYGVFRVRGGRRIAGATEEEVYASVGLPWIPPELREDAGEIEAAEQGRLPRLIEPGDIAGDLHCHTNASDGHHSIEELVEAAARRGYAYVLIADHSPATRVTGGLSAADLARHVRRIRAVQKKHPGITVLAGTECDILADGTLDYPDHVLAELDLVVAAVHGNLKQPKKVMTERLCRALANPHVDVLGHPTGRLIGERAPYDVDLDAVLRAAKQHGKAVEINARPERLDLCDVHARRAHELGVRVAISTDTHTLDDLECIALGVATARRGWIERDQVINAWPAEKLLAWAQHGRAAARQRAAS
ncbi:MAG: DNA polymerase/3'-5' exonuclease PolX [Thermodesulfobacteriota bacterium]